MALQSKLFRDDPKLDAALVSDPAHIYQGANSPHVIKIQQALVQLDGVSIATDGAFGPGTASAVGDFKKKRNILNTAGRIDNIVGKKTMAALDQEMLAKENSATTVKSLSGPFKVGDVPRPASFGPTQFSMFGVVNHGHQPSGKFNQIKNRPYTLGELDPFDPEIALRLTIIAFLNASPDANSFCRAVIVAQFSSMPAAKAHAFHYLTGNGAVFNEDANLTAWLQQDAVVRSFIGRSIRENRKNGGTFKRFMEYKANLIKVEDFRNSFGSIDRLEWEVDLDAEVVHVFFQDVYEWHPVYDGLYTKLPGDERRNTNPIHAAMVEMKLAGAKDFLMRGETFLPISLFTNR